MNQFYPSTIPPPLLAEVSHTFFSSCHRTPTAPQSRRHICQTPCVSVVGIKRLWLDQPENSVKGGDSIDI